MSQTPLPPTAPLDFNDIQGDIILGFPKKVETFLFFQIRDVTSFRKLLGKSIVPLITSTARVIHDRDEIAKHKGRPGLVPITGINIAFSHSGLAFLDVDADFNQHPAFQNGQLKDAGNLGDSGRGDPTSPDFDPNWRSEFKETIHGVFVVAGDSWARVNAGIHKIEDALHMHDLTEAAIVEVFRIEGQVRPGAESGHEHFGFQDGISQPFVAGQPGTPHKGQETVRPGVILLQREGDETTTPTWAKDSSFLVFRQLNQLVPEFNKFLEDNPIVLPGLDRKQGSELFGARLVGRWKSGAPIDITPLRDDPVLAADPERNNDFDFSSVPDQTKCPFAAHIRKTVPRSDLAQFGGIETRRIIRNGIAFGTEVSPVEAATNKTAHTRGLCFVSYQSNIENGFQFLQQTWANNINFPPKGGFVSGFDPIIGQNHGGPRATAGLIPNSPDTSIPLPQEFVVSKGGEYFISPSISALRDTFATLIEAF